ncbi:MAG: hypothetical protein PF572_02345 [Patescibacteria group bacterium]|jgi:hypothetical protein|nr:hypothetical protein [Patescibacteria group bacterium]
MRFAFEKIIAVYRLVSDVEKKTEEYERINDINGVIMSIKAEDLMISEGNPAEMSKLYAELYSDIREADKIECDGQAYIVKNLKKIEYRSLSRIEAIIIKPNN